MNVIILDSWGCFCGGYAKYVDMDKKNISQNATGHATADNNQPKQENGN
jgi:hypothetical protein